MVNSDLCYIFRFYTGLHLVTIVLNKNCVCNVQPYTSTAHTALNAMMKPEEELRSFSDDIFFRGFPTLYAFIYILYQPSISIVAWSQQVTPPVVEKNICHFLQVTFQGPIILFHAFLFLLVEHVNFLKKKSHGRREGPKVVGRLRLQ